MGTIIKKIIIAALGGVMIGSLQSCGLLYYPCGGSYQQTYPDYPVYGQGDVIYQYGNVTEMGTRKIGSPTYLWQWANLSIYKRGLVVYVESNGQTLKVYDLRIRGADAEDTYDVEGLTGKALRVRIWVKGGYDALFTVTDGSSKEQYGLM